MNGRDTMLAWLLSEGERLERHIDLFESGSAEFRRVADGSSIDVTRETLADLKQRRDGLNKLLTEIEPRRTAECSPPTGCAGLDRQF